MLTVNVLLCVLLIYWQEFVKPSYGDLVAAILSVYVDVTALTSR